MTRRQRLLALAAFPIAVLLAAIEVQPTEALNLTVDEPVHVVLRADGRLETIHTRRHVVFGALTAEDPARSLAALDALRETLWRVRMDPRFTYQAPRVVVRVTAPAGAPWGTVGQIVRVAYEQKLLPITIWATDETRDAIRLDRPGGFSFRRFVRLELTNRHPRGESSHRPAVRLVVGDFDELAEETAEAETVESMVELMGLDEASRWLLAHRAEVEDREGHVGLPPQGEIGASFADVLAAARALVRGDVRVTELPIPQRIPRPK